MYDRRFIQLARQFVGDSPHRSRKTMIQPISVPLR